MGLVVYAAILLVLSLLVRGEGSIYAPASSSSSTSNNDFSGSDDFCLGYIQSSNISASLSPTIVSRPVIASQSNGGFVVVYESEKEYFGNSYRCIFGTLVDESGTVKKRDVELNLPPSYDQRYPSIVAIADGGFVVVWQDTILANYRFKFRVADSSFEYVTGQLSNPYPTHSGTHENRAIAFERADSGFGILWTEDYSFKAILFDSSGNATTEVVSLGIYTSVIYQYEETFAVAPLLDGKFVFVYSDEGLLFSQHLDASLGLIGNPNVIGSSEYYASFEPSVVKLAGDGLVVTFARRTAVVYKEILAQYLNDDATKNGSAMIVNTFWKGTQEWSSLDAMADGGFVVNWDSWKQWRKWSIFGRVYGKDRAPKGTEFTIMKGVYDSAVAVKGEGFVSCGRGGNTIECAVFECDSEPNYSVWDNSSLGPAPLPYYPVPNFFKGIFVCFSFLVVLMIALLFTMFVLFGIYQMSIWDKSESRRKSIVAVQSQQPIFVNEMDQIVVTPTQPIVGVTRQVQPPPYHTIVYPGHPGAPPAYFYAR